MTVLFNILVPLAIGAVIVALGLGVINMARGGSPQRSQTFMRWRIILQFFAVVVFMAALYFTTR